MPRHVKSALAFTMMFVLAAAAGAFAESHVRIVRLSYLNGQVQTRPGDWTRAGTRHLEYTHRPGNANCDRR